MQTKKSKGYQSEQLVKAHYLSLGLTFLKQNWTIPGGEIDLIFESERELIFVEVKTVNSLDDRDNYLTKRKILALERSIETYIMNTPSDKEIRLDLAFVQGEKILEIYENISSS